MNRMFTIIFTVFALHSLPVIAQNAHENPNPGPRTTTEPKILYDDGLTAMAEQHYQKAIRAFQRLVDRYPLDQNFIDAHLKLAESYLASGKPAQAIEPFLTYIKNHFSDEFGNLARLSLIQAYIDVNKLSEARAMADETLKRKTSAFIEQQALLLKAMVLTHQKKINEARATLDAFESLPQHLANELETRTRFLLKSAECSTTPLPKTAKAKDEGAWITYLQSIKICFKENLTTRYLPKIEHLAAKEQREWCAKLKSKEKEVTEKAKDKSFNTKIAEAFDEVKTEAKAKSKSLLGCYSL